MSNEINPPIDASGLTVYATVQDLATGNYWNGTAFEAFSSAHWSTYAIAVPERSAGSIDYRADFPAVAAGRYRLVAFQQAGGSPALPGTDTPRAVRTVAWDGTKELTAAAVLLDPAAVTTAADAVWSHSTRTLSAFSFSVTTSAFSAGLLPANFAAMAITPAGRVAPDISGTLNVNKTQDGNTTPTIEDGLIGGFLGAFGREAEDDTTGSYKIKSIGGTAVRTFTLGFDTSGSPVTRD